MQLPRRDQQILAATFAAALCVPLAARWYLAGRIQRGLVPELTELCAQPVAIDHVEAGLTGTVRVTGVELGRVFTADAIEASADEIRIERPQVVAHVDGAGDSDLARMIRRVAGRRASGGGAVRRRVRRIVVTGGALVIDVVGRGRLIAEDVELHPQEGGVRVVTGAVRASGDVGPFAIDARFARGAADVSLPEATIPRVLAVGGTVSLTAGQSPGLILDGATFGRGIYDAPSGGGGAITLVARAEDQGVPRPIVLAALGGGGGAVRVDAAQFPLAAFAPLAPRGVRLDDAHATGGITIARAPGAVRVAAELELDGATIDSRAVAERPVPIEGTLELGATIAGNVIDLDEASLSSGAIAAHAKGRVSARAGELELAIDPAPCLAQLESLPAAVRGPLDGMVLDGEASAQGHVRWDLDAAPGDAVELAIDVDIDRCVVVAEAPKADPHALAGSAEHEFPDGSRAVVGPGVGDWVALGDLPSHVDGAFRAAEDARFFDHHGFDVQQIARSLEVDLREGRFARGGSTISQQLVKNEWLSQRRTLDRKVQEAVLTWRLESVLAKRQIFERYLNEIELGPHVFGVGAAARWWFGKPAGKLDVKEAAFLAALTAEPKSMSARVIAAGGVDRESDDRIGSVLRSMRREGLIDKDELERAKDERLEFRREALRSR
ncbi:MAG TPA: biosynthetic peptidoglycan transglycosylase [Kofleriaceae bacterium]|nr:biosynthetic peptidoglycan transglycosylase [Kofleriaceae bacterium]